MEHEPRRTRAGDPAHGCEMCDGEDYCTCPGKNYRATCVTCGGKWPECDVPIIHKFSYNENSEEVMYVAPNGHTRFLGIWEAFELGWRLVRADKKISLNGEII